MSKKSLILIVSILVILVIGIFIFAYLRQIEINDLALLLSIHNV